MPITAPTPIDAAPPVPDSTTPEETFDAQYEAFNTWEKTKLQPGMNALAANVYANTLAAADSTTAAAASAGQAATQSDLAMGYRNAAQLAGGNAATEASRSRDEADRSNTQANRSQAEADLSMGYRNAAQAALGTATAEANRAREEADRAEDAAASISSGPVTSVNGNRGVVVLTATDIAPAATTAEMQAGTMTAPRSMSPANVADAIFALSKLQRVARTSNVQLQAGDSGKWIDITAGTFTQTFDPVATLGQGWFCYLRNSGTGDVTLDPYGSETLDGLTSFIMYPGEVRLLLCDGTVLRSVVINAFAKNYLSSGAFVKPPGYIGFDVEAIGGGQGGAAGRSGYQQGSASGTVNGSAGGVPGARRQAFVPSGRIAASITVTVGAGGLGGTTQGTSGGAGGASIFGATAILSSGSSGVPELTGIVGTGSIGGTGGSISYSLTVANTSAGAPGAYIGSGVTIPSGGASETYGDIPNIAGTYSATGTAGQAATADFCSGAGGGTATCRMEGNRTYTSDTIVKLTAGKGGNGGVGAGGGAGGHALAIWGNGGGLNGSPTFNLTHGIGGNGGPGLVSIWGVI